MEEATSFTNEVAVLFKNPANFYNIVMENSGMHVSCGVCSFAVLVSAHLKEEMASISTALIK